MSLDALSDLGIEVVEYDGPRLRITSAWWKALFVLVVGTFAVGARANARGRDFVIWVPLTIYAIGGGLICVLIARQVLRVRRLGSTDTIVMGWGIGGVSSIPALRGRGWRGWQGSVGSPVVGLVLRGGEPCVVVDQQTVGLVAPQNDLRFSVGHRGDLRWLIATEGDATVALRLFGSRVA